MAFGIFAGKKPGVPIKPAVVEKVSLGILKLASSGKAGVPSGEFIAKGLARVSIKAALDGFGIKDSAKRQRIQSLVKDYYARCKVVNDNGRNPKNDGFANSIVAVVGAELGGKKAVNDFFRAAAFYGRQFMDGMDAVSLAEFPLGKRIRAVNEAFARRIEAGEPKDVLKKKLDWALKRIAMQNALDGLGVNDYGKRRRVFRLVGMLGEKARGAKEDVANGQSREALVGELEALLGGRSRLAEFDLLSVENNRRLHELSKRLSQEKIAIARREKRK